MKSGLYEMPNTIMFYDNSKVNPGRQQTEVTFSR